MVWSEGGRGEGVTSFNTALGDTNPSDATARTIPVFQCHCHAFVIDVLQIKLELSIDLSIYLYIYLYRRKPRRLESGCTLGCTRLNAFRVHTLLYITKWRPNF